VHMIHSLLQIGGELLGPHLEYSLSYHTFQSTNYTRHVAHSPSHTPTPSGALLDVVMDRISHTKKILNMIYCDGIPHFGCIPLEENASGFVDTINTTLESGE
jgi:hypothetical protein